MTHTDPDAEDLPFAQLAIATPGIPKTLGILNIIFASLLLLQIGCSGIAMVLQAAMLPALEKVQRDVQAAQQAQRAAQLKNLADQEKAAVTAQEKAQVQAQRAAVQAQPAIAPVPNVAKMMGMTDRRVQTYYFVDFSTGFIVNVAMLIAGIGLVTLKEWGRVLALMVAALKCMRLILVYGFCLLVIVPIVSEQIAGAFQEIGQANPAPPAPGGFDLAQFAAVIGAMSSISAATMMLLGLIYPTLCLWFLTRPGIKAACRFG